MLFWSQPLGGASVARPPFLSENSNWSYWTTAHNLFIFCIISEYFHIMQMYTFTDMSDTYEAHCCHLEASEAFHNLSNEPSSHYFCLFSLI